MIDELHFDEDNNPQLLDKLNEVIRFVNRLQGAAVNPTRDLHPGLTVPPDLAVETVVGQHSGGQSGVEPADADAPIPPAPSIPPDFKNLSDR